MHVATIVDKNWQHIVGRGMQTVNNYCTKHNVLLRQFHSFLRRNRTCFLRSRLRHPLPSSNTVGQIGRHNIDFFRQSTIRLLFSGQIKDFIP